MSDEEDTTLDVGKHAPRFGDGTTTPSEASDPYTITSEVPGRDDTGLSDIMTSHNPSLKTHSPFPKNTDINDMSIIDPTNSKEYTTNT